MRLFLALYARQTRQRGRTLLSVLGVALGIALGFGVDLVNRAAVEDLTAGVRAIAGEADLEVRGGRGGFAESVFATVAKLPGIAATSPALEVEAGLADGGALRVIGIDPLRAAQLQPQMFAHQPHHADCCAARCCSRRRAAGALAWQDAHAARRPRDGRAAGGGNPAAGESARRGGAHRPFDRAMAPGPPW
jgi:hypothetical protein